MSFFGKKFKRIATENVEQLFRTSTDEHIGRILKSKAPSFSFERLDADTIKFTGELDGKVLSYTFKLGEEFKLERRNGHKVLMTYTMEGENILNQLIVQADGRKARFRREFGENETKMIVSYDGQPEEAVIYYKVVK